MSKLSLSRRLAAGFVATLFLTACTSGPDYQPPHETLTAYHTEAPAAAAPVSLDRWWIGFNDPELTSIVERALAQNLDLAASLARVKQAQAAADAAGAKLMPTGELQTQVTGERQSLESPLSKIATNGPGYYRNIAQYDAGVGASWEIDISGGLHRDLEAAAATAQAAEAEHAGTRITVAADAADAYLQIRGFQARLALAERQIAADDHLLDLVRLRQDQGIATDREVAQADALAAQSRALLPPLRIGLEAQLNRLDVLLGAQPGTYAKELATPAAIPAIPAVTPGDPVDLLRRRPDIVAAERQLAASNARIGSAISDYYPKLNLSALLGFESINPQQLLSARAFQPQAVAGLRWRLFDFGKVDAEVDNAKGANGEALAQYRSIVLRATEDVENALTGLVQNAELSRQLTRETRSLTRARDTAEEAYRGGAVSLIDVVDSDRQLLIAQDDLARVEADTARAAVRSYRALGGGW
ncbi:MAG TPA: efflux transporter outer membrane subunit [Magnetospirillaceae bacterium]|nr:efflux transporter outer membrane subunit [Magnetospirillaceae bacterium]